MEQRVLQDSSYHARYQDRDNLLLSLIKEENKCLEEKCNLLEKKMVWFILVANLYKLPEIGKPVGKPPEKAQKSG